MSQSIFSALPVLLTMVVVSASELYAAEKPTEVSGVISAIDASTRTITLQVGAEAKEFEFGRKTKFSLDGKEASVDQLRIGETVILLVDEALGIAVSIQAKHGGAQSVTIKGTIASIDAAARLIRVASAKGKEQEFEISRRAKIAIAGKEATVRDLTVNQVVTLEMVPGLEVATSIAADAVAVGAKAALKSKAQIRIVIEMSTPGFGKVVVGRPTDVPDEELAGAPATISFLPNATTRLRDDGSYSISYDFQKIKSLDDLFPRGGVGDVRLDRQLGRLLLTPKPWGNNGGKFLAKDIVDPTLGFPLRVSLDLDPWGPHEELQMFVGWSGSERFVPPSKEFNQGRWFSEGGGTLHFVFTLVDGMNLQIGAKVYPSNNEVIRQSPVDLTAAREFEFTAAEKEIASDDSCTFSLQKRGSMPVAISRWTMSAPIFRSAGIGLDKHGDALVVTHIFPNSLAAKSGVKVGDIILTVNGMPVSGPSHLSCRIGDNRALIVKRAGRKVSLRWKSE